MAWGAAEQILQALDRFINFLKAVRGRNAGPVFAAAIAAGGVAVVDFISNWLIAKLASSAQKVSAKLKRMGQKFGQKYGGKDKRSQRDKDTDGDKDREFADINLDKDRDALEGLPDNRLGKYSRDRRLSNKDNNFDKDSKFDLDKDNRLEEGDLKDYPDDNRELKDDEDLDKLDLDKEETFAEKQKKVDAAVDAATAAVNSAYGGQEVERSQLMDLLRPVKLRYGLIALEALKNGNKWEIYGQVNPESKKVTEAIIRILKEISTDKDFKDRGDQLTSSYEQINTDKSYLKQQEKEIDSENKQINQVLNKKGGVKNLSSDDVEALETIHNKQIVRLENEYSELEKRKANAETDKEKADLDKQADKTFERYDALNEELADYQKLKDLVVNWQNNPKDKEAKNQLQNKLNLVKDKLISRQEETSKSNVEKISSIPGQEKELDKKFQLLDREHNLYRNQQNQELLNNSLSRKKGKEQQEDARNKRLQGKKILDDYADRLDSESRQEFDEELRRLDLEWTQRSQLVSDPKVTGKAQHKEEFEKQKAEIQEIKNQLGDRVSESIQDDINYQTSLRRNKTAEYLDLINEDKPKKAGKQLTKEEKEQLKSSLENELRELNSEIKKLEKQKKKVEQLQKGADDVIYVKPKVIGTQTIKQKVLKQSKQSKIEEWAEARLKFKEEKDKFAKDSKEYKRENQKMIGASEQMGEIAADAAIDKIHPGAKPLKCEIPGQGKQGEFDRVYEDSNGKIIIIVEAKGAGSDQKC